MDLPRIQNLTRSIRDICTKLGYDNKKDIDPRNGDPALTTRLFLRVMPGDSEATQIASEMRSVREVELLLHCERSDIVKMRDGVHFMAGDDAAHEKGLQINNLATAFLRNAYPMSNHVVRGPVVILPEESILDI